MKRLFLPPLCALAACATAKPPEPVVQTVEVRVPVPIRCTPKVSPEPDWPDTDTRLKAMAGPEDRYQAMAVGRPMHFGYEAELKAALSGCAGTSTSKLAGSP